jgi:hypothetical protein
VGHLFLTGQRRPAARARPHVVGDARLLRRAELPVHVAREQMGYMTVTHKSHTLVFSDQFSVISFR